MSPAKLIVSIENQEVSLLDSDGATIQTYPVSTSKFGTGTEEGSYQTPLGNFIVSEKHGENEPILTIFKGRQAVGIYSPEAPSEGDLVLTRILWLSGTDPHNTNTKLRYIYFHGTNQEDLIGTPASFGCIRLRNQDMLDLFNQTPQACPVQINL